MSSSSSSSSLPASSSSSSVAATPAEPASATVLRYVILGLIMLIAFTERLYSVLSFESIIHEVRCGGGGWSAV
jgi:hypothetical protein